MMTRKTSWPPPTQRCSNLTGSITRLATQVTETLQQCLMKDGLIKYIGCFLTKFDKESLETHQLFP